MSLKKTKSGKLIDETILKLLKKHNLDITKDVWSPHNVLCLTHKAIEKVAREEKIQIVDLKMEYIDLQLQTCAVKCQAKKGPLSVITFGECSPKNNRNSYPVAMAEKRAIDRAVLKLAGLHGHFYSQDEVYQFVEQANLFTEKGEVKMESIKSNKDNADEEFRKKVIPKAEIQGDTGTESGLASAPFRKLDPGWLELPIEKQIKEFSSMISKATNLDRVEKIKSAYKQWIDRLKSENIREINSVIRTKELEISPHSR